LIRKMRWNLPTRRTGLRRARSPPVSPSSIDERTGARETHRSPFPDSGAARCRLCKHRLLLFQRHNVRGLFLFFSKAFSLNPALCLCLSLILVGGLGQVDIERVIALRQLYQHWPGFPLRCSIAVGPKGKLRELPVWPSSARAQMDCTSYRPRSRVPECSTSSPSASILSSAKTESGRCMPRRGVLG